MCVMDILGTNHKYGFKEYDIGKECGLWSHEELGVTSMLTECWLCDFDIFMCLIFLMFKTRMSITLSVGLCDNYII